MGAGGFHVRVRDGIGWGAAAMATRSSDAITCPLLQACVRRGKGEVLVVRLGAGLCVLGDGRVGLRGWFCAAGLALPTLWLGAWPEMTAVQDGRCG